MKPTTITLTLDTERSTAVSSIRWEAFASTRGDLWVTYKRNGATYRYDGVYLDDLLPVLTAADEGDSIGRALCRALGSYKGTLAA